MALNSGKKIIRWNWDLIPMPDTVTACIKTLGSNQPKFLTFTDRHGRLIGDVETPGVGANSDEGEVGFPQVDDELEEEETEMPYMKPERNVEIPGVYMEWQQAHAPPQVVDLDDHDIPQDPSLIAPEVPTEPDGPTRFSTLATEGPRRSTRVKYQPDTYIPSMTGKGCEYYMTQIDSQGVLHPDAHMFAKEYFYQSEPEVVIEIMTQFSLKAGLKEWGYKARSASKSEMKQLHLRNTFIPMHRRDLTYEERRVELELHMFLKQKRYGNIKGGAVGVSNKQRTYIPK